MPFRSLICGTDLILPKGNTRLGGQPLPIRQAMHMPVFTKQVGLANLAGGVRMQWPEAVRKTGTLGTTTWIQTLVSIHNVQRFNLLPAFSTEIYANTLRSSMQLPPICALLTFFLQTQLETRAKRRNQHKQKPESFSEDALYWQKFFHAQVFNVAVLSCFAVVSPGSEMNHSQF